MRALQPPPLEKRRTKDFAEELRQRAGAWIPTWGLEETSGDFARALLAIAARFNSEVAERLDGAGEKMRRGFLDWLGMTGQAARPARMPVVFKLADTARDSVLADAPVRLQADAEGTPVVFETEEDVRILPGTLDVVVGVDADEDAFFLPPPGLNDLEPLEPLPTQWQVKSFASAGATRFQLDPEAGLVPDVVIEADGEQYRIVKSDDDLVTIDRPLVNALEERAEVKKVSKFSPFDERTYNQQQHALYLGDSELLNVEAPATIEVIGASKLREGFVWEYWGKVEGEEEENWQALLIDRDMQIEGKASIVLTKPKGEMVEREIGGKKSRWIRVFTKQVAVDASPIQADAFTIRVNSIACEKDVKCPPDTPPESPKAEAMANSTPLVLDNIFLPLGREPRQFDAFYLGSPEAFSKKGATVSLCFEMADPTVASLVAVRAGQFSNAVLAGVGRDESLHLFQFNSTDGTVTKFRERDPLRPPIPADGGGAADSTARIRLNPKCRPVVSVVNNDFFVDVASGGTIWTWHENAADGKLSGWIPAPPLPENSGNPRWISDIVPIPTPILDSDAAKVVLADQQLFVLKAKKWEPTATGVPKPNPNPPPPTVLDPRITLVALSPVWENTNFTLGGLRPAAVMVGVSNDNRLFQVTTTGECTELPLPTGNPPPNDSYQVNVGTGEKQYTDGMRPAAILFGVALMIVTADKERKKLVAHFGNPAANPPAPQVVEIDLPDMLVGTSVEMSFVKNEPQFSVLCKDAAGASYIASWQPFVANNLVSNTIFRSNPASSGELGGPPVALTAHVVAPGTRGDLLVAKFAPSDRFELTLPANDADEDGVVLKAGNAAFVPQDRFAVTTDAEPRLVVDSFPDPPIDTDTLYPVDPPFGAVGSNAKLRGYHRNNPPNVPLHGTLHNDLKNVTLANGDQKTVAGTFLLITDSTDFEIGEVISRQGGVAELRVALQNIDAGPVDYWIPEEVTGLVAPIIRPPANSGQWNARILKYARLYFPDSISPSIQLAKSFEVDILGHPTVMALGLPWNNPPVGNEEYVIDATLEDWTHLLAETASNPELSWEYSTGTAWESLVLKEEATLNFKNTGIVKFKVPDDLVPVDWAGKTNHWIRARLIGGDYGKETVISKPVDPADPSKGQTIIRSTEGIRPPAVLRLSIAYGFCKGVLPKFVLAEDSGTVRDQSDANRTPGAIVEAFVPLNVTIGRLLKGSNPAGTEQPKEKCPPKCGCGDHASATTADASPGDSSDTFLRETGRSIFLGLNATPNGAPVNVLFLVDEQNHTALAPMTVEAIIADRLTPIIADDRTRALGESGILSMAFPDSPTRSGLFGRENLTWLRLKPKASANTRWLPTLRGAYLNAAWASATETLTRELLGSSNGEPNLTVRLARPPVLYNTLELRVKEPLGEEEREDLLKSDTNSVLSAVENLPGDWVLWNEVVDPDDEPENARVYSLDAKTGEIRFGDGRHGKIPPIGRDGIVAFRYSRTEPDPTGGDRVPGNLITARTTLNLVSPVETAENATAADQAAGGAPPESAERVLRFGFARLRHRDRAVTAGDLEDLALQSSPDIVQARAFPRRGYVRLVVAMTGKNPRPNASQIRELRRLLLAAAPISLSAPGALRIQGPIVRKLRVELTLRVESLDVAGDVTELVKKRLNAFFDSSTGGADGDGWALGLNPSQGDVVLALIDAADLESVVDVVLREVADDGRLYPWPNEIGTAELVMLADDPVRIHFETAEATV